MGDTPKSMVREEHKGSFAARTREGQLEVMALGGICPRTEMNKGIGMKMLRLFKVKWLAILIMAGGLTALAGKPPRIPVYYEDDIVTMTIVNANVLGVENETLEAEVAIPLYSFGPPGNQPQLDVVSEIPGEAGYVPWWEDIRVVVLDGRDVTTDPFTSEEEILSAEAGTVELIETDFIFLCQILPGRK
jgi:hypothetical protein